MESCILTQTCRMKTAMDWFSTNTSAQKRRSRLTCAARCSIASYPPNGRFALIVALALQKVRRSERFAANATSPIASAMRSNAARLPTKQHPRPRLDGSLLASTPLRCARPQSPTSGRLRVRMWLSRRELDVSFAHVRSSGCEIFKFDSSRRTPRKLPHFREFGAWRRPSHFLKCVHCYAHRRSLYLLTPPQSEFSCQCQVPYSRTARRVHCA